MTWYGIVCFDKSIEFGIQIRYFVLSRYLGRVR